MTVDEAARIIRREKLESEKALTILFSCLCHDSGKPEVTEFKNGRITSHGHEQAGEEPTKKFLATIGIDNLTRAKVVKLVTNHLTPTMFYIEEKVMGNKISAGAIRRLAQRIFPATIQELVYVSEADHRGRGPFGDTKIKEQLLLSPDEYLPGEWLLRRARELDIENSRPVNLTRGKEWMDFEYKGGPDIGKLIKLADELRDDKGFSKEAVFQLIDGIADSLEAVKKLESLLKEKDNK